MKMEYGMNRKKGNGLNSTGKYGTQIVMIIMIYYDFICVNLNYHNNQRSA
jgi:hypothetical protein